MASRSIASGTVSFGLVAIPIKLYAPIDSSKTIRFNQIHQKCGCRVKQQLHCPTCDEVVPRSDLVKGYECSKGQYVLFSEEELQGLVIKPTHAVEIVEFVPLDQVDPIFFERSYFLGPDRGGEKPYRLLAQTLMETSMAALGQYAARGKQYLVLVRPYEQGLIMQQLHYADEIRDFSDVPLGEADIKPAELDLAKQLVGQTSSDQFVPGQFEDEIRYKLLNLIERKVEGREVTASPAPAPKAKVIDLMDALKASLSTSEPLDDSSRRKPPQRSPRTVPHEQQSRARAGAAEK